jgi:hypothetical protein
MNETKKPGWKGSIKLFKGRSRLDIKKYSFTSRVVDHCNALSDGTVFAFECYYVLGPKMTPNCKAFQAGIISMNRNGFVRI